MDIGGLLPHVDRLPLESYAEPAPYAESWHGPCLVRGTFRTSPVILRFANHMSTAPKSFVS